MRTSFFVGQSYNLSGKNFSTRSGFSDEASAVVTKAGVSYSGFSLAQKLRIDRENGQILRQRTGAFYKGKLFSVGAAYTFLETGQARNDTPREELTSQLNFRISEHWHLGARFQQDLELSDRIRDEVLLTYQDDCTYVQVVFDRDHRQVGTIEPETQVRLVFARCALGGNAPDANW